MLELVLKRLTGQYDANPVLGVLFVGGKLMFTTLEPPWLDNAPQSSCIPPNIYRCSRKDSPRFGLTYEVRDVPNRSDILFHVGNYPKDTHGCILLASGYQANQVGISDSERAISLFHQIVKQYSSAMLTIRWVV